MRRYAMAFLVIIFGLTFGCGSTHDYVMPKLEIPLKSDPNDPKQKPLSSEEREKAKKLLLAHARLLEILSQIEKDIKGKKRKADFFDFALKDDDKVTLQAAELLLEYIAQAKVDIDLKVRELNRKLGSAAK